MINCPSESSCVFRHSTFTFQIFYEDNVSHLGPPLSLAVGSLLAQRELVGSTKAINSPQRSINAPFHQATLKLSPLKTTLIYAKIPSLPFHSLPFPSLNPKAKRSTHGLNIFFIFSLYFFLS